MRHELKRKIVMAALALTIVSAIATGGTVAYFTDKDEELNTFSMGNIQLSIAEPNWGEDDGKNLKPGSTKLKDPTVFAEKGRSYMRVRMEIKDGSGEKITDANRLQLILDTLYYDSSYQFPANNGQRISSNLEKDVRYHQAQLDTLLAGGAIEQEYNHKDFRFAGSLKGDPSVRYYDYIGGDGIFDATVSPKEQAVLFTNVVIPLEWMNESIYQISGDSYTLNDRGGLEVTHKGQGYQIDLYAEAIQSAELTGSQEGFARLDAQTGAVRDIPEN